MFDPRRDTTTPRERTMLRVVTVLLIINVALVATAFFLSL